MNGGDYVHGYSEREAERLGDQARTLTSLLHSDTRYPAGSRVLEAGCGTGAQTVILAKNSPDAEITSVDISPDSIRRAEARVRAEGITNVTFLAGDLFSLPFAPESFDHVFVCFVLEHLADPVTGAPRTPFPYQAGRDDHGYRRRSRLGVFPPEKCSGRQSHPVPCRSPAGGRGKRPYRPGTLPAACAGRVCGCARIAEDGVCRRLAAGTCRGVHPADVHRDGRRGQGHRA